MKLGVGRGERLDLNGNRPAATAQGRSAMRVMNVTAAMAGMAFVLVMRGGVAHLGAQRGGDDPPIDTTALSLADRQAIVEILRETKKDLPAYFAPANVS